MKNFCTSAQARAALALSFAIGTTSATAADVVARGDARRGAQLYEARCGGCHSVDSHRVGPLHKGVFGRRAGGAGGFDYSPAMRASRIVWNEQSLDAWLADPEQTIPGQGMGFRVERSQDRADLIEYLRGL